MRSQKHGVVPDAWSLAVTTCSRFERVVLTTVQVDPAMAFYGSSPYTGDMSGTGVVLPASPTVAAPASARRYLVRLCGLRIGPNARCIIRSIRQLLTIGYEQEMQGGLLLPVELPVSTPNWHFADGNVSWHLRRVDVERAAFNRRFVDVPLAVPPFSEGTAGLTAAILARNPSPGSYIPLNRGMPYGTDVAGLGTFRDIRYPWVLGSAGSDLGLEILGPADLLFFASVLQTDPERRPRPIEPLPDLSGMTPEDRFVFLHPGARYWRVGAELIVDICNPEGGGLGAPIETPILAEMADGPSSCGIDTRSSAEPATEGGDPG